jgi:1,4-alpha-glucan branching enzyme
MNSMSAHFEHNAAAVLRRSEPVRLGPQPHARGVTFRVHAPEADRVYVTGDFNDWAPLENPLEREAGGYWCGDVPEARPGQAYEYLVCEGGRAVFWVDPYALELTAAGGDAVIHEPWQTRRVSHPPPVDERIACRVDWDELQAAARKLGDERAPLEVARARLAEWASCGVNVVELPPFPDQWTHLGGTSMPHAFAVPQQLGGAHSLAQLVAEAHERGIAVVMDLAYDFARHDRGPFLGAEHEHVSGVFPRVDATEVVDAARGHVLGDEYVRRYLADAALHWLEDYSIDGLGLTDLSELCLPDPRPRGLSARGAVHAARERTAKGFFRSVVSEVNTRCPRALVIAHGNPSDPVYTLPVRAGGLGFDAQCDSGIAQLVWTVMMRRKDWEAEFAALVTALRGPLDPFSRLLTTESIDPLVSAKLALPERLWPGRGLDWCAARCATLAASLVMTAPGTPCLPAADTDEAPPGSWRAAYRAALDDLIALRASRLDKTRGLAGANVHITHVDASAKALAYHRWDRGGPRDSTVVVVNAGSEPLDGYRVPFPRAGNWRVRFDGGAPRYDRDLGGERVEEVTALRQLVGDGIALRGPAVTGAVRLAPYSVLILSQD